MLMIHMYLPFRSIDPVIVYLIIVLLWLKLDKDPLGSRESHLHTYPY